MSLQTFFLRGAATTVTAGAVACGALALVQSGRHDPTAKSPPAQAAAPAGAATRAFFSAGGYAEVETPYAVASPGEEVHLRAFRTEREHTDGTRTPLWLH